MNFLLKLSIKTKITWVIISVSLVAIIVAFTIITFLNINSLKKDLISHSSLIAKLIAEYSEFALLFDDTKVAVENLENLKTIPYIIGAELYNSEGEFLASYNNQKASKPNLKILKPSFKYSSSELRIFEPAFDSENEWIGTIYLRVSLKELNDNVNTFILWMVLIILLATIIITLLASTFQKIISKPILDLAGLTTEISKTGDYSMRIHKKSNDEIGILYDGFNNMLEVIVRNEIAMLQAQDKLKDSEERFSTFMEMLPAAAFIKEQDSTYSYVNKFLNEQFNASNWLGKSYRQVYLLKKSNFLL